MGYKGQQKSMCVLRLPTLQMEYQCRKERDGSGFTFLPTHQSNLRDFSLESVHDHSGHKLRSGVTIVHVLGWLIPQL